MVLVGVIAVITGAAYVFLKNKHVAKEDRKQEIKSNIAQYDRETEQLKLEIKMQLGQASIFPRLLETKSKLQEIPDEAVVEVPTALPPAEGLFSYAREGQIGE